MKLICKYTETLIDYYDNMCITIEEGKYYDVAISDNDKEKFYIGEDLEWLIWGIITDYFCTLPDWRELQINKILEDD